MKKPNIEKMQAACDGFNATHSIGADVFVQLDNKVHSAVIYLEDVTGCYLPVKAGDGFKALLVFLN